MSQRLLALDALRGLAVLLMIEQHLGVWLWAGPARGQTAFDYPVLVTFNALGGGAAPLFIVLAGIGSALLIEKRDSPDLTLFARGLAVMGFGLLLNLLTPSWFTWRSWFVLHLMGLGMCLAPGLRRLPTAALLASAGLVLAATPLAQDWLATPAHLDNTRMAGWAESANAGGPTLAWAPLRLALVEGQFPALPWLALYLAGLVSGRWIAAGKAKSILWLGLASLTIGGAMAGAWAAGLRSHDLTLLERSIRFNVPFFPASPAEVLVLMGLVLIAVHVVLGLERRRPFSSRGFMVALGRASLTLLLLHVVLFREVSRPLGLWQALSPGVALSIMIGFVIVAGLAARQWQRIGYRGGAEWVLRRVAP